MSSLDVLPVRTRSHRREFIQLPWRIYQGDPHWVPPIIGIQAKLLGWKSHPFYDRAESESYLALRGRRAVGRVLAIVNRAHLEKHHDGVGFFGFFECEDDPEAAAALLHAVGAWLKQRGILKCRGPVNPSLNYEAGLLVDGFEERPYFLMPHHPAYYQALLTSCGFRGIQDLYAYRGNHDLIAPLASRLRESAEQSAARFDITVRSSSPRRLRKDLQVFLSLYNRGLDTTWGFVPVQAGEIDFYVRSFGRLIDPELLMFAEAEGQPVGVALGVLDFSERMQAANGRLFPFGWLGMVRNWDALQRVRIMCASFLPGARFGPGLLLMMAHSVGVVCRRGFQEAEFSYILESNWPAWKTLERGNVRRAKTYRIYERDFN